MVREFSALLSLRKMHESLKKTTGNEPGAPLKTVAENGSRSFRMTEESSARSPGNVNPASH